MDDIVATSLEQPIEGQRKSTVERAFDDLPACRPDALVQRAIATRERYEVRVDAIAGEVLGQLDRAHFCAAAVEAAENMEDANRSGRSRHVCAAARWCSRHQRRHGILAPEVVS